MKPPPPNSPPRHRPTGPGPPAVESPPCPLARTLCRRACASRPRWRCPAHPCDYFPTCTALRPWSPRRCEPTRRRRTPRIAPPGAPRAVARICPRSLRVPAVRTGPIPR